MPQRREPRLHARREVPVEQPHHRGPEPAVRLHHDPRRRHGRRDVGAAVDQRGHQLDVHLRLDVAAHRPAHDPRPPLAVAEQHPRQQRVRGPPPRLQHVGMRRIQRERGPAVLEVHAGLRVQHARPEAGRVGLDQAHGVAVRVHDGKVDRAAHQRPDRGRGGIGAGGVDARRQVRGMVRRQQPRHRHVAERGVGEERVAIREHELRRLQLEMEPRGVRPAATVEPRPGRRREPLQHVEGLERHHAAAVRGMRRDPDAAVRRGDRRLPRARVPAQVRNRERRPRRRQPAGQPFAQLAVVVGVEPLAREGGQRARERRQPDPFARSPGTPVGPPHGAEPGAPPGIADRRGRPLHGADEPVPGREPGLGLLDRGSQDRVPRQPAPPAVRIGPRPDGARHADPVRSPERDPVQPGVAQPGGGGPGRRPTGPVERDLFADGLVPHQPERVAADAAAVGHDHAQDRVRGDRRVDRVAARGKDREPGRRRQVMGCDDGAAGAAREAGRDECGCGARLGRPDLRLLVRHRRTPRGRSTPRSGARTGAGG